MERKRKWPNAMKENARVTNREREMMCIIWYLLYIEYIFSGNLLMVVGGSSDGKVEDKGYVISLNDSIAVPSCLQSICDFPYYFYGATSGIFKDLPTICGGRKDNPSIYSDNCYKFNYTNAWEPAGAMKTPASHGGESTHGTKSRIYLW